MSCILAQSIERQFLPDLLILHLKPDTGLSKMASSKRGSLGGGPWDAFRPNRFKSKFSGSPYNPLQADYRFEQSGIIQKGVLSGRPFGHILPQSFQNLFFPDPAYNPFKTDYSFEQNIFIQGAGLRGKPLRRIAAQSVERPFCPDLHITHQKPLTVFNKPI